MRLIAGADASYHKRDDLFFGAVVVFSLKPWEIVEEAVSWGLAGRSVPAAEVLETALEIARDIAVNCAPVAVGLHKHLMWRGLDMSRSELAAMESRALNHTMTKPDAVEGGMAYFERRPPSWSGRISRDWPDWLDR